MKVICTSRSRDFLNLLTQEEKDGLRNTLREIQKNLDKYSGDDAKVLRL